MITFEHKRYVLDCSIWLPRGLDEVFAFFSDAGNLQHITPPMLRFHILSPSPIRMGNGTLIDYKLRVRGLPMRWTSRIVQWQPPHRFVDEQVRGPYKLWRHLHEFTEENDGTRVRDRVEFLSRGGPLARLIHRAMVNRDVMSIFNYRSQALAKLFPPKKVPSIMHHAPPPPRHVLN